MLLLGLLGAGHGWLNGDAAAYAAQAWSGALTERWTHVGYVALISLFAWTGPHLTLVMDLISALTAATWVYLETPRGRPLVGWAFAGVVLPWCAFGEVDLLWMLLVALAARLRSPSWSALCGALAVSISPASLLALPWVALRRGEGARLAPLWGALSSALCLIVISAGGWLWGERGLLQGPELAVSRTLWAWAWALPWWLWLGARGRTRPVSLQLLSLLPLCLLPADVPAWLLGGLTLCGGLRTPSKLAGLWVLLLMGRGGLGWSGRVTEVADQHELVVHAATTLRDRDAGLLAPWTLGARVSVEATGEVYGLRWLALPNGVRDQRASWCADPPRHIYLMTRRYDGGPWALVEAPEGAYAGCMAGDGAARERGGARGPGVGASPSAAP